MIDPNDDLGLAQRPYRVVAALAVYGRLPLLDHTIRRLYQKNGCYKVICSGSLPEDRQLAESLGAVWVHHDNRHLGGKWNAAFYKAKDFDPDAVVFVGSSDFISNNWFEIMKPYVDQYGFAGVPGSYMLDIRESIRGIHWPGYAGCRPERANETIGVGRMLSRRLLDAIGWLPFKPILKRSLDYSMKNIAAAKGFHDYMVNDDRLKALSISTSHWSNFHQFEMHYDGRVPSIIMEDPETWALNNFPEALVLHETLNKLMVRSHI